MRRPNGNAPSFDDQIPAGPKVVSGVGERVVKRRGPIRLETEEQWHARLAKEREEKERKEREAKEAKEKEEREVREKEEAERKAKEEVERKIREAEEERIREEEEEEERIKEERVERLIEEEERWWKKGKQRKIKGNRGGGE